MHMTPIVDDPADTVLTEEIRNQLHVLAVKERYRVGIISGRSLDDLKSKVELEGIIYAGNHGLEIEGPGYS
jgi:trehalose 6-phosphate phosphatase